MIYDSGWKNREAHNFYQPPVPRWQGETLAGCKILLVYEQVFGDIIQFIRYAPQVIDLAAETTLWIPDQLKSLQFDLHGAFKYYTGQNRPAEHFDFACPFMSLPFVFKTDKDTISQNTPYVYASPAVAARWREVLDQADGGEKNGSELSGPAIRTIRMTKTGRFPWRYLTSFLPWTGSVGSVSR